jgi:exodeoxyribonuclease V gamma subunit
MDWQRNAGNTMMTRLTEARARELRPGFSMIHSNRLERLRQVAVQWVRRHPLNPLDNEVFLVQSNGMGQWLKLALAENDGCGISAALQMQLPARFLWHAYRAVLGAEQIPAESPFDKERLTWRLLRMIPDLTADERFSPLQRFLADDAQQRKRYQLSRLLADLFDQYQVYRADWLAAWSSGTDRLYDARGESSPVPSEQLWQPELWRRIQADLPSVQRDMSRAALHRRFLQAAQTLTQRPAGLPRRVIVFGICSLPQQTLSALHALALHCQVLLFVHNPCRHFWADIIEDRELLRIEQARHARKAQLPPSLDLAQLHQHVNPLLAAWGKQGRDYIGLLYGYDQPEVYRPQFGAIDLFENFVDPERPARLLQQVQQAILDLQPLPANGADRQAVAPEDRSILFQAAHSRQREVEILQDQLLSFFQTIPDLTPRDIIVMAPDINAYAPHIEAVFGSLPPGDVRTIPFTIADRPERSDLPLLQALDKLLRLPELRLTVSDVMDLLEVPAFRDRFGIAHDHLPTLRRWIEGAGIRWGLHGQHRSSLGLPVGLEQNTWHFGLQRMLLGYAVGSGEPWRGIAPYDEVGGLDAVLAGPLATLLSRLEKYWHALSEPASPDRWCDRLTELLQDCFHVTAERDRMTRRRLDEALEQWRAACAESGLTETLSLPVVRDMLLAAVGEAGRSQRFLAGMVNFGTLMPMRAIPFKVVCLLGMNDGDYPRSRHPVDFDLMAGPGRYRPGDRSRREDDRYLFLEALLSARHTLYISYIGRSVHDNSACIPSVLVGQLRDYLAAGWCIAGQASAGPAGRSLLLEHLTDVHPLQPFSRKYFSPDRPPGLFTYAHEWREILDSPAAAPATAQTLPAFPFEGSVTLQMLTRFLKNPVQSFFNQRLGVYFDGVEAAGEDQEPFCLDALSAFGPGARLLLAGLEADVPDRVEAVARAAQNLLLTGELPLNGFGELAAAELAGAATNMIANVAKLTQQWPYAARPVELHRATAVAGCTARALEDWLDGLHQAAENAASLARWEYYYAALRDKSGKIVRHNSFIGVWVKHLAGCAQGLCLTSWLVAPDGVAALPPLTPETAGRILSDLFDRWWNGMQQPLPVAARTALAYCRALVDGKTDPAGTARQAYEGDGFNSDGEVGASLYLQRLYPDFDALWQLDGRAFHMLADALYAPLVRALMEDA